MSVKDAFDAAATDYDGLRRKLIPCFDDFYAVAVSLLPFEPDAPIRVLDLGAGTGLLAWFIRQQFPAARLTLVDVSEAMLDQARARFADSEVEIRVADYANADLGGEWDAIVSALSIHHLEHPAKRALFQRVAASLRPGGVFVNAEQVLGETEAVEARNLAWWLAGARALGATEQDLEAAALRMRHDIMARVDEQLQWMGDAGLTDTACHYKHHRFAVLAGQRAAQAAS